MLIEEKFIKIYDEIKPIVDKRDALDKHQKELSISIWALLTLLEETNERLDRIEKAIFNPKDKK